VRTIVVEASNIASFDTPSFEVNDASESNSISIFAIGEGTYEYRLINEKYNISSPFQGSNYFENVYPGIYKVEVRDIKNDCGTIDINVPVIGFPKFFTPNNDGVNDTWQILKNQLIVLMQ